MFFLVNNPCLMGKMVNTKNQNALGILLTIAISAITMMLFALSV